MLLKSVEDLKLGGIKVFKFGRFTDRRGYFTETYRKSDVKDTLGWEIMQTNESFSHKYVIRGLHFQWNPYMGKLVRTVHGHMVDIVLDIRIASPTFGKAIMYNMPSYMSDKHSQWIWVPPGFAHGNFFLEPTVIEYYCSGQYSEGCEGCISPFAEDIDWSLCDTSLLKEFKQLREGIYIITEKDEKGYTLEKWLQNKDSKNFMYKDEDIV